jgi:hypothetical protein
MQPRQPILPSLAISRTAPRGELRSRGTDSRGGVPPFGVVASLEPHHELQAVRRGIVNSSPSASGRPTGDA